MACPSCGKKIPLTRALRAEIETSLKAEFGERERELRDEFERKLDAERERVGKDAAKRAEKKLAQELAGLHAQLKDQAKELEDAGDEAGAAQAEQALERQQADLGSRSLQDPRRRAREAGTETRSALPSSIASRRRKNASSARCAGRSKT